MTASDPAWQFFAILQNEVDPKSVDRSLARGEALDAVLDEVLVDPSADRNLLRNRFGSLCRNRLSKQTHRRAIDADRFRATHRRGGTGFGSILLSPPARNVVDDIAYAQITDLIRTVLDEDEFRLLLDIADGDSYADLVRDRNITISNLKSKVFRARQKIRNSRISTPLQCGFAALGM